jgi:hypothetical protein
MRERTLVTGRQYFGMDALRLRAAASRVLARVVGLPPEQAMVSARNLRRDFHLDTVVGKELVHGFVAEGLLEPRSERPDGYRLTERFMEFARARVVEPLQRDRARELGARASDLAQRINLEWTRNPLEIDAIAAFGCYMSREAKLVELPLAIVVRPRSAARRARWGRAVSKSEGARTIRVAFRELSSFVRVHMVSDRSQLPRPFALVFDEL